MRMDKPVCDNRICQYYCDSNCLGNDWVRKNCKYLELLNQVTVKCAYCGDEMIRSERNITKNGIVVCGSCKGELECQ